VMIILAHDRRKIMRTAVSEHPTEAWLSRQVTEAFPWDTAPRCLLRDRDSSYGAYFRKRIEVMGIKDVVTAPRSPWQNPYVERVIGSIRRECLDHIVIFNERHCAASCPRTPTTTNAPARIFRSIRIARTPARFSIAASEESSPFQESVVCTITTNVWPLDTSLIPAHQSSPGGL
jgi:transposase InsO family protein